MGVRDVKDIILCRLDKQLLQLESFGGEQKILLNSSRKYLKGQKVMQKEEKEKMSTSIKEVGNVVDVPCPAKIGRYMHSIN